MEIKIEKGIQIPNIKNKRKYPFELMELGDSFFIENTSCKTLYAKAMLWRKNDKATKTWKFRAVQEKETGACIWRIA